MTKKLMVLGIMFTLQTGQAWSQAVTMCESLIRRYEAAHGIPHKLLTAISLAESGRKIGKSVVAWPWTINANGTPYVFASKGEAIRMVRKLRLQGMNSIDVGCMQVNLKQHPKAFPTLEAAFDPATNIAYAAKFLKAKKENKGSWVNAVAHYHSATPEHHVPYRERVLRIWKKAHGGGPSLPQYFPEETSQMPFEIPHLNMAKHEGEFVKKVAAPSGRRVPMIVRFAPYKGFNGGISGLPHRVMGKKEAKGPQLIRSSPLNPSIKIFINAVDSSQKAFQVPRTGAPPKIIYVSAKTTKIAVPRKFRKAKTSKFRAR